MLISLKSNKPENPKKVKIRLWLVQVFAFLILKMGILCSQNAPSKKIIVIDPGHGGTDSGAVGINGILEKVVVLAIANEIVTLNHRLAMPYDIYLSRHRDTLISLSDRTKLGRALKADLFISLHCNHSDNPNARGIEVYVTNAKSNYLIDSTWLAFLLQEGFKSHLGFESRGVKFANFQVLRETAQYCPAVLLELGFLSNRDESLYINDESNLNHLSTAIINILKNW